MTTLDAGDTFATTGLRADQVTVPDTGVYRSADGRIARRYRAGDRVSAAEAALLGIATARAEAADTPPISTEAAVALLRGRGYQVTPMATAGPMGDAPGDAALIAHLQARGFEIAKPGDTIVEVDHQRAILPAAGAIDPEAAIQRAIETGALEPVVPAEPAEVFIDGGAEPADADADADAKADASHPNKAEPAPANKAERPPRTKTS